MPAGLPEPVVYDTGALVAADRSDRRFWAEHRVRLEAGTVPLVPAPVVAQASRAPSQVQLRRLLRGCDVVPMTEQDAHAAGRLLARSGTSDVVDAAVALCAASKQADIVTSDRTDIERLARCAGGTGRILEV
jgi:predicted nucleic acid-binding protein